MAIDMSQFFQIFFEESEEHLATMESLLLALDVAQPDSEQLNAIFRAAHSIKGSAGTFGFTDLAEVTHVLENVLDRIRKGQLALRTDMVDVFLKAGDVLRGMLAAHQGQGSSDPDAVAALCASLAQLEQGPSAAPASPVAPEALTQPTPAQKTYSLKFVPTQHAASSGAITQLIAEWRAEATVEVLHQPSGSADDLAWELRITTAQAQNSLVDVLDFVAESGSWQLKEEGREVTQEAQEAPVAEYGFFVDLPDPPVADAPGAAEAQEDEGFGFFAPLAEPSSGAAAPAAPVATASPNPPAKAPEKAAEPVAARRVKANGNSDSSIRVSVEKVDQLINLVGELVITQAILQQSSLQLAENLPENMQNGLTQLESNTRDLQEAVMSIRMLPISAVFSRFPRVVRDVSGKLGKQVELKTTGEATELDKGLIEQIADPLTHLIRNSLDHGIEMPEARLAAGKPAQGTISLRAFHQGGSIVIEVEDDGAGLPREKILKKARERGLPVSDAMSDNEVYHLIFEPGFSTADVVSDVSGRGVGMDVVRRNIQGLGGRVDIDSQPGAGTRMTVRLPLTLAILDGMSVAVGDQLYILPLACVLESLQAAPDAIRTMGNQAQLVQVRGEYLPVVALHEMFGLQSAWQTFSQGIMVVLDADGVRVALFVDALVGQHQVVIKSLEANYRKVSGVAGATIMGDGRVALILDVTAIAGMARQEIKKSRMGGG
ncbi:chemotaxis protein CheW [Azonexus sp.]|uniref:chemotaxis protein CheW n=1 Tax=Azonexus sp. TaxID=1872668 RepID=UPI0039E3DCF4